MRRRTFRFPGGEGGRRRGGWVAGLRFVPPSALPLAALAALVGLSEASAQQAAPPAPPPHPWVGLRAFTQPGTVLQIDGKVVEEEGRDPFRVYKVERSSDPWLWIVAEKSGAQGWVQAGNLIPLNLAIDYYTSEIQANPSDASAYLSRGGVWMARGEFDIAIADLTEAIRFDPAYAAAFNNRGLARRAMNDYDKAIADYTEAIRLDSRYVNAYANRGDAWSRKRKYEMAIADYNAAIRLDPNNPWPYFSKALTWLSMTRGEVVAAARASIEEGSWRGKAPIYAAIVGNLGARRVNNYEAANAFLVDADAHADKTLWPYPIVRYLRREIDENTLLGQASGNNARMIQARCFLGFDQLLRGDLLEARRNFEWVKNYGTPGLMEVDLAAIELDRLPKEPAAPVPSAPTSAPLRPQPQ